MVWGGGNTVLTIVPTVAERQSAELGSETIQRASRSFRFHGALVLENIVDVATISKAHRAFDNLYFRYLDRSDRDDVLKVGDHRLMITITLEPPFDDPQLFANPYLLSLLRSELGDGFVLGAFGVVCSLPSAPTQHRHCDGGVLFPETGVDKLLPATAITVGIPLIEMNEIHGTTALWLGSHRNESRLNEQPVEPVVHEGSCLLWDFRLMHGGTPNQSAMLRPLIYLTYCRPWYIEHVNFNKKNQNQKPLLVREGVLSRFSEPHQRLLARALRVK
jgi:ectoine hydroxylase-related dioxygenase (phytanoyl-CoA dioxygenase family)